MARTQYAEIVTYVDTGVFKPADNTRVSVFLPGTTTTVTIYTTRSAGTTKANPFTTDATGAAEFWAEWGDYDIKYEDLTVPARFGTKTFGWSSTSGANAAIPLAAEDAVIGRQYVPIGAVIDWWRPVDTVSIPTGWAICDGSVVASGNHDFGTGASITLPDLRNVFVLGANSSLADGAAATAGDAASNAPGIRGSGSSHGKNLQHSHTVNSHDHGSAGVHSHSAVTSSEVGHTAFQAGGLTNSAATGISHGHDILVGNSSAHTHSAQTPGTDSQLGTAVDVKPQYVGLLKIMKIKRN
jgi:hypothetical protein